MVRFLFPFPMIGFYTTYFRLECHSNFFFWVTFYLLLRFYRLVIFPLKWFFVGKYNTTFFIKSGSRLFTMTFGNQDFKFKHVIVGRGQNLAKNSWHWSELKAKKKVIVTRQFLIFTGKTKSHWAIGDDASKNTFYWNFRPLIYYISVFNWINKKKGKQLIMVDSLKFYMKFNENELI
jgi:hypothetical protein